MSHVSEYHATIKKQTDEICKWVDDQNAAGRTVDLPRGPGTGNDLRGYLDEYSYKWGMTALVAGDINYPGEDRFYKELEPYDDLQEIMD